MENPELMAKRPVETQEEKLASDSRSLAKRLLTFGLTDQVKLY